MDFYAEPAFFVLCLPIAIVAVFFGLRERSLSRFGLMASIVMLFLLFFRTVPSLVYAALYVAGSVALYVAVRRLFSHSEGKDSRTIMWYRLALAAQIAPLALYKVWVAVSPDALGFLGISYITFKAVQVLVETSDGLIDSMTPTEYLAFLCFFPTFTSGPILRSRAFVKDLRTPLSRDAYLDRLYRGIGWFVLGAVYKFVCSAMASWGMWMAPSVIGVPALAWVATVLCFGINLFFDFAGYSNMAMGLGLVLGIEVPRNFRAPFVAKDIMEFWERWHITLSTWLRDFVFMRFSRFALAHKLFKSRLTTPCVGFMLNMALMGVWHGITVDYIAYGLYHGVLLAGCHYLQKKWKFYKKHRRDRWFNVLSWAVTMIAVFFGFALFGGYVFGTAGA